MVPIPLLCGHCFPAPDKFIEISHAQASRALKQLILFALVRGDLSARRGLQDFTCFRERKMMLGALAATFKFLARVKRALCFEHTVPNSYSSIYCSVYQSSCPPTHPLTQTKSYISIVVYHTRFYNPGMPTETPTFNRNLCEDSEGLADTWANAARHGASEVADAQETKFAAWTSPQQVHALRGTQLVS